MSQNTSTQTLLRRVEGRPDDVGCELCGRSAPACAGGARRPDGPSALTPPDDVEDPSWDDLPAESGGIRTVVTAVALGAAGMVALMAFVWFVVVPRFSGPAEAAAPARPESVLPTQPQLGSPPLAPVTMDGVPPIDAYDPTPPEAPPTGPGDGGTDPGGSPVPGSTDTAPPGPPSAAPDPRDTAPPAPGPTSRSAAAPRSATTPGASASTDASGRDLTGVNAHGFFYETGGIPGALTHMGTLTRTTSPEFGHNVAVAYNALNRPFAAAKIRAYSPRLRATITMDCVPYPDRSVGCYGGDDAQVEMW